MSTSVQGRRIGTPARTARQEAHPEQVAAALGLDEGAAREQLARFGRWSAYR
jgi:hypothetical protein